MSRVQSTVPLAGLPLTSAGHRLFLPLNDPEESMPNAVITLIAAAAAVAVRCPLSLPLYAVTAAEDCFLSLSAVPCRRH